MNSSVYINYSSKLNWSSKVPYELRTRRAGLLLNTAMSANDAEGARQCCYYLVTQEEHEQKRLSQIIKDIAGDRHQKEFAKYINHAKNKHDAAIAKTCEAYYAWMIKIKNQADTTTN